MVAAAILTSAELYDIGLGFVRPDWQPQITTATSPLITGSSLILTGSRFQGISQASGGNFQDSSTNYPVVQLRNIDNSQVAFLPVDPMAGWSDTTFTSTPVSDFPPGPALVTVFTNGIPSDSKYLVVTSTQVVSRKMHNGVPFDINLPLTGNPGIECRSGGASNDYQVVFTFSSAVTFTNASVTGVQEQSAAAAAAGRRQRRVNLTGVANAQTITVTLLSVNGARQRRRANGCTRG